jgi:Ca-activated chloride channel family protein
VNLQFGNQAFLWVAGAVTVLLALAFALDFTRRRRLLERLGHAPQLRRMAESVSGPRRVAKAVFVVLGAALVAVAAARPQTLGEQEWRQRGIDLAIVMDFSKSMLVADMDPDDRVTRVKHEVDQIVSEFAGDRVAIVAFAGAAIHYPLTVDYEAAQVLYTGLDPADMPPGSDLGSAILTARCLLRPGIKNDPDCERVGGQGEGGDPLTEEDRRFMARLRSEITEVGDRARAMVIFSDGDDTEGRAQAEIKRAAALGIEVFVVGVGTPEGGPIPELDSDGEQTGWVTAPNGDRKIAKLEENILKQLARDGGGEDHYLRLHPRKLGTAGLVKGLRRLKEGDLAWTVIDKRPQEIYHYFLFPGFMLLLVEAVLSDRRRAKMLKKEKRA